MPGEAGCGEEAVEVPRLPLRQEPRCPGHTGAHRRVPEDLAHRQVSEVAQGHKAAEEARKGKTAEAKQEFPRKFAAKGLEAFAEFNVLLRKSRNRDPHPTGFR